VYLQSDAGDFVGAGRTATYSQANAIVLVNMVDGYLGVSIDGDDRWSGSFQAMSSVSQLQPGYYPGLRRFPFNNPATGGLDWSGSGGGCNTLSGWFVVDSIVIADGKLSSIDLRFEQHCEGAGPALHGQIHWVAGDVTRPPGPQNPPPAGLWAPAAGATPTAGSYIYLQSDVGDYIGQGGSFLYTPDTAAVVISGSGTDATVSVNGAGGWNGNFAAMYSVAELLPGYYGDLRRWPFHNRAKGGLGWYGEGRGCNSVTGWFVVDSVRYANGALAAIDLRFEQHCEGAAPALRGKIHWVN
jgi:hypothetical protein